jgi:MscS family membrane protein
MSIDIDQPFQEIISGMRDAFGNDAIFALALFVGFVLLALVVSYFYSSVLTRLCARTKTDVDDRLIAATRRPVMAFVVLVGLKAVFMALEAQGTLVSVATDILSSALLVLFAYVLIKTVGLVLIRWGTQWVAKTNSQYGDTILPLLQKVANAVIAISALIAILGVWGIEVTPFLAGLGIAGLAVGLALQDSLKDLVSGVSLIADRTYKVGDKLKLDSGEVGDVHEITLRSTRIRTYDNNIIIIPNGKMATSKLVNYAQPLFHERGQVPFGVVYGSDIEKTKQVALDAVMTVSGILEDPAPTVEFLELADYSLTFRALFWVPTYGEKWGVERKAVQAIYEALNAAGIDFAFPTQTVYLEKGE